MRALVTAIAFAGLLLPASSFADRVIEDFENVSDWTGLDRDTAIFKSGASGGRWDDHANRKSVRRSFATPLDLSAERHLQVWIHSAVANGALIEVVADSDNPSDPAGWDYYRQRIEIDWTGWKLVRMRLADFVVARKPIGWNRINYISFSADGWSHAPLADTVLVFDDLAAGSGVIGRVDRSGAWEGDDYVFTYSVELEDRSGAARTLQLALEGGAPTFSAALDRSSVSLAANGRQQVQVRVTAADEVIRAGSDALTFGKVRLTVSESGLPLSEVDLEAFVPLRQRPSPRLLLGEADFARIATWAAEEPWAAAVRDGVVAAADRWPADFQKKYGQATWRLPPEGGQWSHWYVCPTHGVGLTWEGGTRHVCRVDGQVLSGWPYDQVIYTRMHNDLATSARDLALAYRLTGQDAYAASAAAILLAYADAYGGYALHDKDGGTARHGGRVLSQTLDESGWLISIAWAYDLVATSGALDPAQRRQIEEQLLRVAAATIARYQAGASNWQSWHNTAIGAAGFAIDDPALQAAAVKGAGGFEFQMGASVTSDGFWYEGSWGYHFYALDPLWQLAEMATRAGLELWARPPLRAMFTAPIEVAMPDWKMPAFNDSGSANMLGYRSDYEVAYARTGDPRLGAVLDPTKRSREALFFGQRTVPSGDGPPTASNLFPEAGYAILRSGDSYLALDFGPHGGGHGHFDKLGFVLFARGAVMTVDPGSQPYAAPTYKTWDKKTVAHNTVVVDEGVQAQATGALHRFLALPGLAFASADAGEAWATATRRRAMLLTPEYALDQDVVDSRDGAAHDFDWVLHGYGTLTTLLTMSAYAGLPAKEGYQHLTGARSAQTDGAWEAVFDQTPEGSCGSVYKNVSSVTASMTSSREQSVSGEWSAKLRYDFSAGSGYVLFTPTIGSMPAAVPVGLELQVYGDGSGNKLSVRLNDANNERWLKEIGPIDWTGWRSITTTGLDGWTHYLGDANGIFDAPASSVVVDVASRTGAAATGSLYVDDVAVLLADGKVTVADFEVEPRTLRVHMLGGAGTRVVTGQGLGPNLLEPVPFVMARRRGVSSTFNALLEPAGGASSVEDFAVLDAPSGASAFMVKTAAWRDRLLAVADGDAGERRGFGGAACDGRLCLVRQGGSGPVRLGIAEGTRLEDEAGLLLELAVPLAGLQADYSEDGTRLEVTTRVSERAVLRLLGPAVTSVFVNGAATEFTQDGDYVVLGLAPVSPDAGLPDASVPVHADGGSEALSDAGVDSPAIVADGGCGCAAGGGAGAGWMIVLTIIALGLLHRRASRSLSVGSRRLECEHSGWKISQDRRRPAGWKCERPRWKPLPGSPASRRLEV